MTMENPNLRGLKSSARLDTRGTYLGTNTIFSSQVVKTIQPSLFLNSSNHPPYGKILENTMSGKEGYKTL